MFCVQRNGDPKFAPIVAKCNGMFKDRIDG